MEADHEETDYESPHRELESQREDMESRRDDLADETQAARQDIESKVSDQNVPGAQDEAHEVIYGREAVEGNDDEDEDAERERNDSEEGGGSEGAGYREE